MLSPRLAGRELRAALGNGVRGLRIVLACLALGVAVIGAVGSLRAGIAAGLARDGSRLLGGDLEIQSGSQPLPDTLRAMLRARGATLSDVVQFRSLLVAPDGSRQLVAVKAVDGAWPLRGAARFDPPGSPATVLARKDGLYGLAADPLVFERLRLKPGDIVKLGDERFVLRARIAGEPDRISGPALFGAPVLIPLAAVPATGLIVPGAIVEHALRLTLPPGVSPAAITGAVRAAFPGTGWRIRDAAGAAPGVERLISQTALFLSLAGLTALLVGGIGVANGVRAWLGARARSIATLRCLGASGGLVFRVYLLQVMALAAAGIAAGLVAGAALPLLLANLLAGVLPVPPVAGIYPGPLALAGLFGLLTAAGFALWPLGRAARISGASLFRDAELPAAARPGWRLAVATGLLALLLAALVIATAPDRRFAAGFCLAAAGTLLVFRLGAAVLMRLARLAPALRSAPARLGLAALHRPGAATPLLLVSLGLGLSTLAAVTLIEGNIRAQVLEQMPADAPSFFFIDIQPDQLARFDALAGGMAGVSALRQVPSLRARVVSVAGVPAEQVKATPQTRWALRGDRGLTYAATPPAGTHIVAGSWWPKDYAGPPLLSLDAGLAEGWGVHLGDTIVLNVLGRDIGFRVASLRRIVWQSLALNFTMVASPVPLQAAPHTHIATVRADPAVQGALLRRVSDALPNVTGIAVDEILKSLAGLLGRIAAAVAATGSLTLAAGVLVLGGAVAAGQGRRVRQAVILKSLGATRAQIRTAWLVEFGALGLAAGAVAALVGTAASWAVMHFLLHAGWVFLPGRLAATVLGALVLMLIAGHLGTAAALRARAAPWLRNE